MQGFDSKSTSSIEELVSFVDKEKVLDAGADLYLPKPYDLISLYNWINKILSI